MSKRPGRFERQKDVVPKIDKMKWAVIGVGAVGRPIALTLAAMGAKRLLLIDPDTVELHNCAVQGYRVDQINRSKVGMTRED